MSKSEVDQDGFTLVVSKRKSKHNQAKKPVKDIQIQCEENSIDVEKVLRRIDCTVKDLRITEYFNDLIKAVSTALQNRNIVEIVCFGLGRISECNISRHQLALLLCIKDAFSPSKVVVHDPIFCKSECEILKRLNLEVLEENCEGSYELLDNSVTLAYFPHCPKQLTNNFLWCNWGSKLRNCLLICNSFNTLIDNNPSRIISESVPYIYKIHPHTQEIELKNNFKYTDIFNDTSLHYFSEEITNLNKEFWQKGPKPTYKDTEEFITSLMINKLTL